ncbi:ParB N-terminal domain-containing protein [Candidatus Darwinibacter acetoxidans]
MITAKKELIDVPISDLIPYERNPRKNDKAVKKVAASLERFGLVKNSVVVDENMVLITGHTTLKAMQSLGWTACPAVTQVYGLTEEEKRAYRIADNKLGELAEWDLELLALEFEDLMDMEFDLSLTGFSDTEIDFRFPEIPDSEPEYDESIADDVETVTCPKCNHEFPV